MKKRWFVGRQMFRGHSVDAYTFMLVGALEFHQSSCRMCSFRWYGLWSKYSISFGNIWTVYHLMVHFGVYTSMTGCTRCKMMFKCSLGIFSLDAWVMIEILYWIYLSTLKIIWMRGYKTGRRYKIFIDRNSGTCIIVKCFTKIYSFSNVI